MADRHGDHDLLLVAAFAAGDADAADRAEAEALVAGCSECSVLATDLVSIARATAALPAPRRPRDFFLQPADTEPLRSRGFRGLAGALARQRGQLTRPLAGGLMMIGLAGLLVASLPGMAQLGAAPTDDQRLEFRASQAPASEVQGGPVAPDAAGAPAATDTTLGGVRSGAGQAASGPPGSGVPATSGGDSEPAPLTAGDQAGEAATGPSALTLASVALVAMGALVFLATLLRPAPRRS